MRKRIELPGAAEVAAIVNRVGLKGAAVELSPDGERILKVRVRKMGRDGCVTTWMNYNTFLRKTNRVADRDTEIRGVEEGYSQPGLFSDVPARERRIEKAVRA